MSYAYNHRKKEIKRHKRDRLATIGLFGDIWRYRFNGRRWRLEKEKRIKSKTG